jgi:hypothetical protein
VERVFYWSGNGEVDLIPSPPSFDVWELLGAVVTIVILVSVFLSATRSTVQRHRFWCAQSRREVEVEFEVRGLPGFRKMTVRSCSVFDPPTAVRCRRRCVDIAFRRQWEPPLPISA